MIQSQTQTQAYWQKRFELTDADVEQIYNHLLEVEQPQTADQLASVVIAHRVAQEKQEIKRRLAGRVVYQPAHHYEAGDELVFPALNFAYGSVVDTRPGRNPEAGRFTVIVVEVDGKQREFAADLEYEHVLNSENGSIFEALEMIEAEELTELYGSLVTERISGGLDERDAFVRLANKWFLKALLTEVTVGHLNLAEAVLDMFGGGPLPPEEILPHLDLGDDVPAATQAFSLNYALLKDERFDEVAPPGKVGWYLRRMEPQAVREVPGRLEHQPFSYNPKVLTPELRLLEQELDDEWSALERSQTPQPVMLTLTYPHRWAGTLPLSARTSALFPVGRAARQRVVFIDEQTQEEIIGWVVREHRYVYGLDEWYRENEIPVGGFISLRPGPEPGVILLDFDRRRGQREWVRLASVDENRIRFSLDRRTISCGYDDLMIVGTDYVAAVDALWRRAVANNRPIDSLLRELFPELAELNPQQTVHAKTLYSAINMLRRVPPGPLFAELVTNPVFVSVGDYYWQFEPSRD